jgi:hypothetical protein
VEQFCSTYSLRHWSIFSPDNFRAETGMFIICIGDLYFWTHIVTSVEILPCVKMSFYLFFLFAHPHLFPVFLYCIYDNQAAPLLSSYVANRKAETWQFFQCVLHRKKRLVTVADFRRNIARGATVIRLSSSIRNHSCDGAVKAVAPTRQNTCTTDILTFYPYFTWLGPHKTSIISF